MLLSICLKILTVKFQSPDTLCMAANNPDKRWVAGQTWFLPPKPCDGLWHHAGLRDEAGKQNIFSPVKGSYLHHGTDLSWSKERTSQKKRTCHLLTARRCCWRYSLHQAGGPGHAWVLVCPAAYTHPSFLQKNPKKWWKGSFNTTASVSTL